MSFDRNQVLFESIISPSSETTNNSAIYTVANANAIPFSWFANSWSAFNPFDPATNLTFSARGCPTSWEHLDTHWIKYSIVDQSVGEGVRMLRKLEEIGTWTWAESTGTSRKADRSWTRSYTEDSWLNQTKRGKQHSSGTKWYQGLASALSSWCNNSGLGKFVRPCLFGWNHPNENFPQEESRLQVPQVFLQRTAHELNEYVRG
jgi:hypothetical protein